jgi:hypothetical protein
MHAILDRGRACQPSRLRLFMRKQIACSPLNEDGATTKNCSGYSLSRPIIVWDGAVGQKSENH